MALPFGRVVGRLARAVTTPVLPGDYLDMVAPLREGADLRGRVEDVRAEARDAATITIRPGRGWRGHVPGQYLRLGVDVAGVRRWRTYSLTSTVGRGDVLVSITVKAVPGGTVSHHLVHGLRPGTLVHLGQPAGEFTLGTPAPERVLFLTAGSGITPVMGMLRNHLAELADVVVIHSAPTGADVMFAAELRALHATGRIRLVERHTVTAGRLTMAELPALCPDWADRQTWACGPVGLLDAVESHWASAGLAGRLQIERFRPVARVTGAGGTVTFTGSGTAVYADGAATILDAAEDAGVLMPSGCRMGICFGCALPLREGAVRDVRTGELTTAAPGDGVRVQTCVSAAVGPCDIDH